MQYLGGMHLEVGQNGCDGIKQGAAEIAQTIVHHCRYGLAVPLIAHIGCVVALDVVVVKHDVDLQQDEDQHAYPGERAAHLDTADLLAGSLQQNNKQ